MVYYGDLNVSFSGYCMDTFMRDKYIRFLAYRAVLLYLLLASHCYGLCWIFFHMLI